MTMTESLPVPSTHGSHHHSAAGASRGRLLIVLALVVGYLLVEVIGSLLTNSLALLADAGHMLTDAVGVALALLAIHFAARPATATKSYGYYRLEILAAVGNAVLLFGVAAYIGYEAYQRFREPPDVHSLPMLAIAAVGLVVNLIALRLLASGAQTSLNLRGAYLEVLGDALGSIAVVVSAAVILTTGWDGADSVASLVIAAMIVPRALSLLREVGEVLLESTPRHVDLAELRTHILEVDGVREVHDLHVWTITSGMPVMSAHIVVDDSVTGMDEAHGVLDTLRGCLSEHFDVEHSTFQIEPAGHAESEGHVHH